MLTRIHPLGIVLCVALAPVSHAADILVSKTSDSFDPACVNNCSLREAIHQANQAAEPTRILLAPGVYQLTLNDPPWNYDEDPDPDEDLGVRGDLDVVADITLVGAGQAATVIQGSGDRLLEVVPGASLQLRQLTLRDGLADTYGGAIRNHGDTQLRQVSLLNNRADAGIQGQGGAIANFATLSVSHALFEGNNSNGDEGFFGRGGAIFNMASLQVRDSTFRGNSATDDDSDYGQGGALYNEGTADVARSTFAGNSAGMPLYGGGGSAIANRRNGVIKLTNSTLSGNPGIDVNGVFANGIDNFVADVASRAQLINVTIAGNGGLGLSNVGEVLIRNSLIAGNQLAGVPANCSNQGVYQARGLLLGTDQGNCLSDVPVDDGLTWTKVLHPLAANQGSTWSHGVRQGSPALDAGVGSCTQHDQRGFSRPRDGDGDGVAVCDLGAFERSRP